MMKLLSLIVTIIAFSLLTQANDNNETCGCANLAAQNIDSQLCQGDCKKEDEGSETGKTASCGCSKTAKDLGEHGTRMKRASGCGCSRKTNKNDDHEVTRKKRNDEYGVFMDSKVHQYCRQKPKLLSRLYRQTIEDNQKRQHSEVTCERCAKNRKSKRSTLHRYNQSLGPFISLG